MFLSIKIRWDLSRVDGWKGAEARAGRKKLLYGVRELGRGRHSHRYF